MNRKLSAVLVIGQICVASRGLAQQPPQRYVLSRPIDLALGFAIPRDRAEEIRRELLDTNLLRLVALSVAIPESNVSDFRVAGDYRDQVSLYRIGGSDEAFSLLSAKLDSYARARADGHTRRCLMAALTNSVDPSSLPDPGLRALVGQRPLLPPSWLTRLESGTITNMPGDVTRVLVHGTSPVTSSEISAAGFSVEVANAEQVRRWSHYSLVDGEFAWVYAVNLDADGSADRVSEIKYDRKDFDPAFATIVRAAEKDAGDRMRRGGTLGNFGSLHIYWSFKRQYLEAHGIRWRSPVDLNPGKHFD